MVFFASICKNIFWKPKTHAPNTKNPWLVTKLSITPILNIIINVKARPRSQFKKDGIVC